MNNKTIFIIIAVIAFVTVFALALDVSDKSRSVRISGSGVALNNDSSTVLGGGHNINVNLESTNISGTTINAKSQDVNISRSSNITSSDVSVSGSDIKYSNQDSNYKSDGNINYQNLDTTALDTAVKNAQNIEAQRLEAQNQPRQRRYLYKNIDWSTWKSNFVNQILDDSVYIRELDNYNEGDWVSYSFYVDKRGRISKISVLSPTVSQADRDKVAKLIKSYEYQDITLFPENSKKSIVKVFAVIVLSNYTKKTSPKDFNEHERVRVEY